MAAYQTLIVEAPESAPGVALIRLNRPEALNALNTALLAELAQALAAAEADDAVGAIVLTGSAKAFAAGADIKEMSDKTYAEMFKADFFTAGARAVEQCRKPIIAAVAGYALGGGCELAMMCDMIIAADTAKFGQPEINLGVAPGIGREPPVHAIVDAGRIVDRVREPGPQQARPGSIGHQRISRTSKPKGISARRVIFRCCAAMGRPMMSSATISPSNHGGSPMASSSVVATCASNQPTTT